MRHLLGLRARQYVVRYRIGDDLHGTAFGCIDQIRGREQITLLQLRVQLGELRAEHRDLQQWASDLRDQGLNAEALLVQGPTVDTLVERAEHLKADVIVLGSHGHGAVYRALVGSVSEGVLRKTKRPLLIVPVDKGS